jgi:hypothetical protein
MDFSIVYFDRSTNFRQEVAEPLEQALTREVVEQEVYPLHKVYMVKVLSL